MHWKKLFVGFLFIYNPSLADPESAERSKSLGIQFGFIGALLGIASVAGAYYYQSKQMQKLNRALGEEKKRSENLLLNILPGKIADELKEKGSVAPFAIQQATVIFTDFKDFTLIAEKLSPSALVEELDACFRAFDDIISKYRVEKIKAIGDSYMAAGGITGGDASVENTVMAAIEMQEYMINRKQMVATSFEMRIGLHTGPVVAGVVGSKKFQFDIWGDTVNTASRMESTCEPGKVNISWQTFDLVKSAKEFQFLPRGKMPVKGKEPVEMYYASRA